VVNLIDPKAWKSRPPGKREAFYHLSGIASKFKVEKYHLHRNTLFTIPQEYLPPTIENPTHFGRGNDPRYPTGFPPIRRQLVFRG